MYNGGTNIADLSFFQEYEDIKLDDGTPRYSSSYYAFHLLVTDGFQIVSTKHGQDTYENQQRLPLMQVPVFPVCASIECNEAYLNQIAKFSGGLVIKLAGHSANRTNLKPVVNLMLQSNESRIQFLGVTLQGSSVTLHSSAQVSIPSSFSIELRLHFLFSCPNGTSDAYT